MDDKTIGAGRVLEPDENIIPTGLPGGFFIYSAFGDEEIYFAEQNVIELFGCKTMAEFREYTRNSFMGMVHPDDLERVERAIKAQTQSAEKNHDYVRYRIRTKQGQIRYIEDFGHLLHGRDGRQFFYVYIVDVDKDDFYSRTRNSFAEAQIASLNQETDSLTGLLKMNAFLDDVQKIIDDGQQRAEHDFTFVHFDIANFKMVNESRGFQRGDDLLRQMATLLVGEFPEEEGRIARFSNDHFAVFTAVDDVPKRIEGVGMKMAGALEDGRVDVNAGIYRLEDACTDVAVACDYARVACNTVKRRYDMPYGVYDIDLYERIRLQQYVVETVNEAAEKNYLQVVYQPIVRMKTGKVCGFESLVRWNDPKMGPLSPAQFVPTLEEFHTIDKVDSFVMKRVCEDLAALIAAGEEVVPVSVNLSQLDFELCDIFDLAERYRGDLGVPANLIDIEITESALNGNSSLLIQEVRRFHETGYRVWVDDFGSGYSSLNNLLSYEFDVLKLDLEFLHTLDREPRSAKLIEHIVRGAHSLGVESLQEGVETSEHLEFLAEIGCDRVQGYYFSRPMPLGKVRALIREKGLEYE